MKRPKKIPAKYFNELKSTGTCVPRYISNGEVIMFGVSSNYIIMNEETNETINARCIQSHPIVLKTIEPDEII